MLENCKKRRPGVDASQWDVRHQRFVSGQGAGTGLEDEGSVRAIIARTLRDEGYDVVEAPDGREALALLEEHGRSIAIVLTDMVMPIMGGRELGEHLARERPDLPLVYMSGYPRDTAFADGTGAPDRPFLQKPVSAETLVQTISSELARTRSPRVASALPTP